MCLNIFHMKAISYFRVCLFIVSESYQIQNQMQLGSYAKIFFFSNNNQFTTESESLHVTVTICHLWLYCSRNFPSHFSKRYVWDRHNLSKPLIQSLL